MQIQKNILLEGRHGKAIALDTFYQANNKALAVVLFAHGFKGFKDWGHWDLIGKTFAEAGFLFIKFNFAFNGTTIEDPLTFGDLEAFGQNNYMKEFDDLDVVLDWIHKGEGLPSIDKERLCLIGHSRGGGLSVVKAANDTRISHLITWAAVDRLNRGWDHASVDAWKEAGVINILNGRTKQLMPLYYQHYETFVANADLLDVQKSASRLKQEFLIIHGTEDPAVSDEAARNLKTWAPSARLAIIEGANHVFGGKHPYEEEKLPEHSQILLDHCLEFLK